jgi:hypothetical protein
MHKHTTIVNIVPCTQHAPNIILAQFAFLTARHVFRNELHDEQRLLPRLTHGTSSDDTQGTLGDGDLLKSSTDKDKSTVPAEGVTHPVSLLCGSVLGRAQGVRHTLLHLGGQTTSQAAA